MKYKEIDGFKIPLGVWEEIKDTYVNIPTEWEIKLAEEALNIARNSVKLIDETINEKDYTPSASSDDMWNVAHQYANDKLIQQAIYNDEILTEKLIEILTGINSRKKENEVLIIIFKTFDLITECERMMYH